MEVRTDRIPRRILFLCSRNSCRSQMAEGFARAFLGPEFEVLSAGLESSSIDPLAAQVMAEVGVDLRSHTSKSLSDLTRMLAPGVAAGTEPTPAPSTPAVDLLITVCKGAHEACPTIPGVRRVIHRGFDDPPSLATSVHTLEDRLDLYRRVRDEISTFVRTLSDHSLWNEKKPTG